MSAVSDESLDRAARAILSMDRTAQLAEALRDLSTLFDELLPEYAECTVAANARAALTAAGTADGLVGNGSSAPAVSLTRDRSPLPSPLFDRKMK